MTEGWTIEELVQILQQARTTTPDRQPGLLTAPEYSELSGMNIKTTRLILKDLMKAGLAEPGHEIIKRTVHGTKVVTKGWLLDVDKIQGLSHE